ncbi:MAG TPA: hypothetical protein VGK67_15630 [Myxococcales bacterium]|jgi:hypothetical protein
MKSLKRMMLGVLALSLAACGGSIQNKQDAVTVLQRMESMGAGSGSTKQGLDSKKFFNSTVNLQGQSGTATCEVSTDIVTTDTSVDMTFDISATLKAFSPDGKNTYDGTETLNYTLKAGLLGGASGSVAMTVKADMTVAGDYNNHVNADVTMTLDASVVSATNGTVKMVVDGTITADGTTYTYDNETFTVAVSQ